MKRKIFNTLKHKLQWLVLLTALLGMSQRVWGYKSGCYIVGNWDNWSYWHSLSNTGDEVTIDLTNASYEYHFNARRKYDDDSGSHEFGCGGCQKTGSGDVTLYHADNNNYAKLQTTVAGKYKFKLKGWNGNNPIITVTFPSSCSTPSNSDISITAPSSATTLYLGSGSAPYVTQTVTATCSKGNTYSWESNRTGYSYSGAWGSSTSTNVAFTSSSSKSTTATFYHEGVYTATFKAGCGNTTDASKDAPTITVKPGYMYFGGPLFDGGNNWNYPDSRRVAINTSTNKFIYEWTAAYTSGEFLASVGNVCGSLESSAYTIGNYADLTLTGVTMASSGNHNFSPNIGTISVGDRLRLTVEYTGLNASNIPHYNVTLEKFCNGAPMQNIVDILDGTKVWFYAGILSSWNQSQIKCKLSSTDNGPYDLSSKEIYICSSTKAKIAAVNLPSANYCLHHPSWTDGCANMGENDVAGKIYVLGSGGFCSTSSGNQVKSKSGISLSNLKFDNGSGGTTKTVEKGSNVSIFAQSATTANPWGNGLKIKYYVKKSGESTYYTECDWEASVANTTGTTGTLDTDNLSAGTYTVYALLMNATSEEEAVKASTTLTLTINSCTPPEASNFTVTSDTNTYVYNGSAHSAKVTGVSPYTPSNIVAYYGANSSATATSQTDAGTYNIYVHSADAYGDYCAVTSTIATELATQLVINPVTPSSSNYSNLFSISGTGSHAYTGESQSVTVAWKSPYTGCKGVITVKYDGSETAPTNAGSYPITISVASGTNNNASASDIEIGTLTITPIDQSTAVTILNSGTHCIPSSGSYVDISASGGDTSEALTYSVVGTPSSGISLSDGRISATKAGSITVTATRPGGANYNDKTSSNFTFTFVVTPTSVSVTPASPVTHTLPSSVTTPSVTQSATATHTGNRTAWTLSPNYTVNTISDASATNPTSTFKREGVYTATVGVGCNNTTDVSSNSATITVEPPLTIYLSGTLVSSAQDAFGDNNFPMTRTEGSYVYTRRFNAVAGSSAATNDRKFSLRESNSSGQADYLIPKYAKVTYTNITTTGVNNDMYTTGITYSAGNTLEVRAEYKGYNSSENKPEWDISIGLVCDAPDSKTISISSESICRGSDVSVVVNSSQSGYIYTVYDAGNTQVGTTTGDGTNKSISVTRPTESTTYTVKAKQAASCTPTEMANTVSVTVNDIPTFSPTSGITQYLPVTVTSDASSPSWTFNKESGSLDGAWLSNTSGASTVFKAPTGSYTVSDGTCATGLITVSDDTETCD